MNFSELEKLILPITRMNIDITHIRLLHSILRVGNFKHALEIGSYDGASAIAFISAMNDGVLGKVDFCDPEFQPRFSELLKHCVRRDDVKLRHCGSHGVISDIYDCIFVDGDHSLPCVKVEAELILKYSVETILAHDTNSSNVGFTNCDGAMYLMDTLMCNGYRCIQDCVVRPGERTDRGFMFATKNKDLFDKVRPLFNGL